MKTLKEIHETIKKRREKQEQSKEMQKQFIRDIQQSNIKDEWKQIILNQFRLKGWSYVRELMEGILLVQKSENNQKN